MPTASDWSGAKEMFLSNLKSVQAFEFTFYNPLFWCIIVALFVVLLRMWEFRSALTVSLLISAILLLNTELELRISTAMSHSGETFDASIFRLFTVTVITFIFLFFAFLNTN